MGNVSFKRKMRDYGGFDGFWWEISMEITIVRHYGSIVLSRELIVDAVPLLALFGPN